MRSLEERSSSTFDGAHDEACHTCTFLGIMCLNAFLGDKAPEYPGSTAQLADHSAYLSRNIHKQRHVSAESIASPQLNL